MSTQRPEPRPCWGCGTVFRPMLLPQTVYCGKCDVTTGLPYQEYRNPARGPA